MKIVIRFDSLLNSGEPLLFSKIASYLQNKYKVEIVAVVFGHPFRQLSSKFCDFELKASYDLLDFLRGHSRDLITEQELASLESRYGIPNLWLYAVAGQPIFSQFSDEKALKIIVTQIKFWESLFDIERPDAFIDEGIGSLILPVWKVAQNYGVSILNMMTSRMSNRFVIMNNPFDRWEKMERIFSELKGRRLTPEEEDKANSFLKEFTSQRLKPPYMQYVTRAPYITFRAPLTFLKYFKNYHREKGVEYFSTSKAPLDMTKDILLKIYRYNLLTRFKSVWEQPRGERYILYPLHYQPENSTRVLAPFYLDQLALIENIAKSLPVNFKLYVKEHQASIGMRPVSYYKRIKNIPNVHLISPFTDSHELIKGSSAVITITSTMGWEAILYQKPVIVFGSPYYDVFDLVYKVSDITKLPYILNKAVTGFKPNRELLLKFILAIFEGTYEGEMSFNLPQALYDENVRKLSEGIASELGLKVLRE